MNENLRNMVLLFLKQLPDDKYERFNKAFEYFKKHPEKSHSIETKLNRVGFSEAGLENLIYDLQKLYGISDAEIADAEYVPVFETSKEEFVAELNSEIPGDSDNSENSGPQDVFGDLAKKILEHTATPEQAPENYKMVSAEELTPIRDEFPFLNEADCPEIMFVVVGKRITAYRNYVKLHEQLQFALANEGSLTEEAQSQLAADTQAANAENLALWDELKYYNENKEILGKHPLFRESVAKKEVDAMTTEQLAKYRTSSATFISKKKTALKAKNITPEKTAELEAAIQDREFRLGLVNTRLGVNGGK